ARVQPPPAAPSPSPAPAAAQPEGPSPANDAQAKHQAFDQLPPPVKLGVRVEYLRQTWPAIPRVGVVSDPGSYVAPIAHWSSKGRFPVLLDDGSWSSRWGIARFVRAFEPKTVERWSIPEAEKATWAWPVEREKQQALVERAAAAAWGVPGGD